MSRPNTEMIEKENIIKQFKKLVPSIVIDLSHDNNWYR